MRNRIDFRKLHRKHAPFAICPNCDWINKMASQRNGSDCYQISNCVQPVDYVCVWWQALTKAHCSLLCCAKYSQPAHAKQSDFHSYVAAAAAAKEIASALKITDPFVSVNLNGVRHGEKTVSAGDRSRIMKWSTLTRYCSELYYFLLELNTMHGKRVAD